MMVDRPLDDVLAHMRRSSGKDLVLLSAASGFANPAAVMGMVQTMPANAVGRERALVVDEDQAEPVADNETVIGADYSSGIALESFSLGSDRSEWTQQHHHREDEKKPKSHTPDYRSGM